MKSISSILAILCLSAMSLVPAVAQVKIGMPSGITLSSAGVVSGTPAVGSAGVYQFPVQACDSETPVLCSPLTTIALTVVGPVIVTPKPLPVAIEGKPYSQPLGATGGVPPYTWTSPPALSPTK